MAKRKSKRKSNKSAQRKRNEAAQPPQSSAAEPQMPATDTPAPALLADDVEPRFDGFAPTLNNVLSWFASLKLTVVLFAMAIFIVLAGTLGQVEHDIWKVVRDYFRIDFRNGDLNPFAFIDWKLFYPPSFMADGKVPAMGDMSDPGRMIPATLFGCLWPLLIFLFLPRDWSLRAAVYIPIAATLTILGIYYNGMWFPKGWLIGAAMLVNLLSAHLMRYKVQSEGPRLIWGSAIIGLGAVLTYLVIVSGDNKEGILDIYWFKGLFSGLNEEEAAKQAHQAVWWMFQAFLAALGVSVGYAAIRITKPEQTLERGMGIAFSVTLLGVLAYLVAGGQERQINPAGMRILWQLLKATFAGLVLYVGSVMVFRKRAGVVVLHAGIALMMISEIRVGLGAVESRMKIIEGESTNYSFDIREFELAVIDDSDSEEDHVVAIPQSRLQASLDSKEPITDDSLPFNLEVVQHFPNSTVVTMRDVKTRKEWDDLLKKNPADSGFGLDTVAKKVEGSSGVESEVDIASIYYKLTKKSNGELIGTYLGSGYLKPDSVTVDGKKYQLGFRFRRYYKPYTVTLVNVDKDDYRGTNTARDYRSTVVITDDTGESTEKLDIWMNNPLRYAGVTLYQSGYDIDPVSKKELTVLQVVSNGGWMIPYVSCMIVAIGMMGQFCTTFVRFLGRRTYARSDTSGEQADDSDGDGHRPAAAIPKEQLYRPLLTFHSPDEEPPGWIKAMRIVLPVAMMLFALSFIASRSRPPKSDEAKLNLYEFGKIPLIHEGRAKPIDSLARNSLRVLSTRQEIRTGGSEDRKVPAAEWLLDVLSDRFEKGHEHFVFRIDNPQLLRTLELNHQDHFRYSFKQIEDNIPEVGRIAEGNRGKKTTSVFISKVRELETKVRSHLTLEFSLALPQLADDEPLFGLLEAMKEQQAALKYNPPQLYSVRKEKFVSYTVVGLPDAVREFAAKHDLETPEDYGKYIYKQLPNEVAKELIEMQLARLRFHKSKDRRDETIPELAKLQLRQPKLRPIEEAVLTAIAASRDDDEPRDIVRHMPDEVIQAIFHTSEEMIVSRVREVLSAASLKRISQQFNKDLNIDPEKDLSAEMIDEFRIRIYAEVVRSALDGIPLQPDEATPTEPLTKIVRAYRDEDVAAFNGAVTEYRGIVQEHLDGLATLSENELKRKKMDGLDFETVGFESYFNHAAPFLWAAWIYVFGGILALVGLLLWNQSFNRAAFCVILVTWLYHTLAIGARIYISGRPPVTSLYSSAVFIGWGCVAMAMIFERIFRIGIGNVVAAAAGWSTLFIAHLLTTEVPSFRGDTFTVLVAVLDTQFWLATHVVCITFGYSATYVAGLIGLLYVIMGVFTPSLTRHVDREFYRMMYATVCFAMFFSFVGTVLGGLWADDSWGRFWGWDPKENGALIIVLWNALVLHARWGGMVRERGFAALCIAGNITVSWSWFGVNELGKGLHNYGFTEGVVKLLGIFVLSQCLMTVVCSLPKQWWWSHIATEEEQRLAQS